MARLPRRNSSCRSDASSLGCRRWPPRPPPDGLGHLRGVCCVCLHHGQALAQRKLGRIAGQGRHAVAALQQFIQQCGAYKAGGANQCDVHGVFLQTMKMLQAYFDAALAVEG